MGNVVEKVMTTHTKPVSQAKQDPVQYGFTETCSLMVIEAIAEAKDQKTLLYQSLMDSSKAFNMVDHTICFNSLHDLEIEPHLWYLYTDMYSEVTSQVTINRGAGVYDKGQSPLQEHSSQREDPFLS